ncbi:MAG: glycoside hydrolase family 2 [Bacteroidales bacterium]|nr:glycoside hydrolase family 2 [Bacteroidales bacterium]
MNRFFLFVSVVICSVWAVAQTPETQTLRQYLSGHGCDDMVEWDFYCTDGNNSGQWTRIGVPSCWELQGFGTYQYGMRFYGKVSPEGIADEQGKYRYEFTLPKSWQGRQIELVFEAVMTECEGTINGRKAGSAHQGGFSPFRWDVSDRVFFGDKKNRLELTVSKESHSNSQTNLAERRADYWNFGGIIRPVYVESRPADCIQRMAIDAKADGFFKADVYLNHVVGGARLRTRILDSKGKEVGRTETPVRSDFASVELASGNVSAWSAETPVRYTAEVSLLAANGKLLHTVQQKFGFRTIELRENDGLFINGHRINVRGVNRHSFRPESGRTLSYQKNLEDVQLIKDMNMNAVRLSHYPADPEFLDICDSLGLYVMEELSGWHWAHDTQNGKKLVTEMVTRDVNHPSIIWWSNGNEGGFNYDLEPVFAEWDPQKRSVLYPWANRNGYETKHYRSYGESADYMRQPELFMPTEFLHGLYDGGHGAGLYDYWQMMYHHPRTVGGFLWDLADEGVVRTDRNGWIDNVGNFGADGIVGPHHEKEGSYYTIRQLWCPVYAETDKNGKLTGLSTSSDGKYWELEVENRYDFLNLNTCRFRYEYVAMPNASDPAGKQSAKVLKTASLQGPDAAFRTSGILRIPKSDDLQADVLRITATDTYGREIMQWGTQLLKMYDIEGKASNFKVSLDRKTGMLAGVQVNGHKISLTNGPRFVAARRSDRSYDQFYNHDDKQAEQKKTEYTLYADPGILQCVDTLSDSRITVRYRLGCLDSVQYTIDAAKGNIAVHAFYNFTGVVDLMGLAFDYPESLVQSKAWVGKGPYRVWQNRMHGPQSGFWQTDYNDPVPAESYEYPEFKGYFADVAWMSLQTAEGRILLGNGKASDDYVGVYTPRDGRDHILYQLPETGLSLLRVIPAVRNKVNTTDLNGPSAQPYWASGSYESVFVLHFE